MSQAKQVKSFVAELNRCASRQGSALFLTSSLVDIAGRVSLEVADFHGFIGVLNEQITSKERSAPLATADRLGCRAVRSRHQEDRDFVDIDHGSTQNGSRASFSTASHHAADGVLHVPPDKAPPPAPGRDPATRVATSATPGW